MITPEYLAGVIDCYGSFQSRIRLTKSGKSSFGALQLRVTMPSREVMQMIAAKFGGTVEDNGNTLKLSWYSKEGIATVLRYCQPHLIARRDEAELFISQCK